MRDLIPEVISSSGRMPITQRVSGEDLIDALRHKAVEEVQELFSASPSNQLEEMADVLEVLRGMTSALGVDWSVLEEKARVKREERGGFRDGVWLVEIEEV